MNTQQACHNCRRQRLKCDRFVPQCSKCIKRGQECLGYDRLFRWRNGTAKHGKQAALTFENMTNDKPNRQSPSPASLTKGKSILAKDIKVSPLGPLMDSLIQDLSSASRMYLSYFASDVCRDLVLHDTPKNNPFREIIPLTHQHPILLQIIVAISALHMSNATQRSSNLKGRHSAMTLDSQSSKPYHDALAAKQRALNMLRSTLSTTDHVVVDVTLAVVILFIEFELIDSGRDGWRHHINGARTMIAALCGSDLSKKASMSPLRSCLISNWVVFDILGSTLTSSNTILPNDETPTSLRIHDTLSTEVISLLQDAEGNHCSSFPLALLRILQSGAQLSRPDNPTFLQTKQTRIFILLCNAKSFDPTAWATDIQPCSPTTDFQKRIHVAFAHQAAVCIYLSRVLLSLYPTTKPFCDFESLVSSIVDHLSHIDKQDDLFTATTWPAFVAGAETNENVRQEWVAIRFREMWEVEPWGIIRGALETLEDMWTMKRNRIVNGKSSILQNRMMEGDWVGYLRGKGVDWLII